ncbi:hypothetical protein D6C85_04287 [Aureobasidium pullulans]|uniref:BTB domain-containing protein n=1 Tax=Aureobasidium pullulans TaxID=5580 RepID=A0A4S9X2X7_AURPU|nr:hypothetical protein D6C85_04287 [Aureobasidium pullulans]TIA08489.1 hypothetical protein D6C81_09082 [Aureobasidium pullulans]
MSAPHPYPFYKQLYNDKGRSDVILRFGDQRVLAHRLILAGASELFHTAFKSKFPVATNAEYNIEEFAPATVHAMIKHIYGFKYDEDHLTPHSNVDQKLDFWIDVLLIANEYRILSLTAVATSSVLEFLRDFKLDFAPCDWVRTRKDNFRKAIKRFVELENNVTLSDSSCQDGVVAILCEYSMSDLVNELQLDKILEPIEPFSARLIRQLSKTRK